MQKASTQLRSNIANATRHRGDKVKMLKTENVSRCVSLLILSSELLL